MNFKVGDRFTAEFEIITDNTGYGVIHTKPVNNDGTLQNWTIGFLVERGGDFVKSYTPKPVEPAVGQKWLYCGTGEPRTIVALCPGYVITTYREDGRPYVWTIKEFMEKFTFEA